MRESIVKNIISILLCVVLIMNENISIYAQQTSVQVKNRLDVQDILDEFNDAFLLQHERFEINKLNNMDNKVEDFLERYKGDIEELGYQPYIVYSDNYKEEELLLNTDFDELGMNQNGIYLLLIEKEDTSGKNEFDYTYKGKKYRLRKISVTGLGYCETDTIDLLESKKKAIIKNCLNTALVEYLSTVNHLVGTIGSIVGIDISEIGIKKKSTVSMHCSASWTRVFTQVYKKNQSSWISGSCTEYVRTEVTVVAQIFDKKLQRMKTEISPTQRNIYYSSKYGDVKWQNEKAIIWVNNTNGVNYDMTGSLKIKYGKKVVKTFYENF